MPELPRSQTGCSMVIVMTALLLSIDVMAAPAKSKPGTQPVAKLYQCAAQLTRPADHVITMEANKTFYKYTDSHDTAEVFPNVVPPASGMDVYRVLSLPTYKGALVDTVIFIEFERR